MLFQKLEHLLDYGHKGLWHTQSKAVWLGSWEIHGTFLRKIKCIFTYSGDLVHRQRKKNPSFDQGAVFNSNKVRNMRNYKKQKIQKSFFWTTRFLLFFFSNFFVTGPCARLSWPSRQLLSARKDPGRQCFCDSWPWSLTLWSKIHVQKLSFHNNV